MVHESSRGQLETMSSHIRTKQPQNPIQNRITPQAQTVGQTYGERRANGAQTPTARPAQARPVDQFAGKAQTGGGLPAFDANATYRTAKRFAAGSPYRPALLNRIQDGTAPVQTSEVQRPSDNAILNFLDRVIQKPELHSQCSIRNTQRPAGSNRVRS